MSETSDEVMKVQLCNNSEGMINKILLQLPIDAEKAGARLSILVALSARQVFITLSSAVMYVLTEIEIAEDNNSPDESSNNMFFEHDDHHREHDNRQ